MDLLIDTETTFKESGSSRHHQFYLSSRQRCWLVCLAICMGTNVSQLLCNHSLLFRTRGRPDIHLPRAPPQEECGTHRGGAESAGTWWSYSSQTTGRSGSACDSRRDRVQISSLNDAHEMIHWSVHLSSMSLPFLGTDSWCRIT